MKTYGFIAFCIVMLIFTVVMVIINMSAITETINDDNRNAHNNANGNETQQNSSNGNITDDYRSVRQASAMNLETIRKTTTATTLCKNKNLRRSMSTTMATENIERTTKSMMMMTHEIEISTAKPSNFNKNSLRQSKGQHESYQQQQQQQLLLLQQQLPQQRHYKHQYTLDNKHPPCDSAENAVGIESNTIDTLNAKNDTNLEDNNNNNSNNNNNNKHGINTIQIDATAKGYKPLITLNTSNSVDSNNDDPRTLLSTTSTSTASTSSTFNVARNGFRDKINISNQRNEFTNKMNDADNNDDNDDDDDDVAGDDVDNTSIGFVAQVQLEQSVLRPTVQKYSTNIKNGLNNNSNNNNNTNLNTNTNTNTININTTTNINTSTRNNSVNNFVVPAMSSFFEHVELAESSLSPDKRHELQLHRRKRYLVFPEGSSFQLVFDLIIGIVDYTSYAILGITCSVAWELPSKPPSEIIENFREKLNEGTYGLQRRNDSIAEKELQYVDTENKNPAKLTTLTTTKPPTTTSTAAIAAPTQHAIFGYENAWKPQNYIDRSNYYEQQLKYAPKMPSAATPSEAASYYGYKAHHEYGKYDDVAPDIAEGDARLIAQAQRKTLNDKAAQWYSRWRWNRPHPDKAYTKYDEKYKNYNTKENYEWRGSDKWKYAAPYGGTVDWHQQRTNGDSGSNAGNSDYRENHDDYNADNVGYDERQQQQQRNYANWRQKDNWWQPNSQRWYDKQKPWMHYETNEQNWNRYLPKRPITAYATPPYNRNTAENTRTGRQRKILKEPPKHRIYPIFGRKKRSRRDLANEAQTTEFELKLERIHLREQLQSRQKLYAKIEQLFQTRGHNGTACVLRALCETGQRHQLPLHHRQHGHQQQQQQHQRRCHRDYHHHHHQQQEEPHSTTGQQSGPQSFITELLRAIFALPKDIRSREFETEALHSHAGRPTTTTSSSTTTTTTKTKGNVNVTRAELLQREFEAHISWHYRDAHSYAGNCAERFASCEHSIWSDGFRRNSNSGSSVARWSSI